MARIADTTLDARVCRDYQKKDGTLKSVAAKHGISFGTVHRILVRNNVPRKSPGRTKLPVGASEWQRRKLRIPLLKKQKWKCAICPTKLTYETAQVDHCHKTNVVRGVLCGPCNRMLGWVNDDVKLLKRCVTYIIKTGYLQEKRRL